MQMPMEEVVKAHTMMEKNEQVGKIVLTMEWIVCYNTHSKGPEPHPS